MDNFLTHRLNEVAPQIYGQFVLSNNNYIKIKQNVIFKKKKYIYIYIYVYYIYLYIK